MTAIPQDPMLYYLLAFLIFIGLAYRFGRHHALAWIDGEIQKVRNQLNEAQRLRAEAESTLAEYKAKQAAAMADADELVLNAKEEAARMKAQAEADLRAALARHEQQAAERIRMAEAEAIAQVRQRAIDLAINAACQSLQTAMQGEGAAKLVEQAIADLATATPSKAKAA